MRTGAGESKIANSRRRAVARAAIEGLEPRLLFAGLSIAQENKLAGTPQSVWDVAGGGDSTLLGYTTDISVNQGQIVSFKVDDTSSSPYQIKIYRLGYYQGNGARLVTTIGSPLAQNQPAPLLDTNTGLVDCGNWAVSASWATPATTTSGVYIADLVKNGKPVSQIPFVIRNDSGGSAILYQTSDSAWEAYNGYGGAGLYELDRSGLNNSFNSSDGTPRSFAVSYNRPFINRGDNEGPQQGYVFDSEFPMIQWLEQNGYDVSYSTDVDTARYPSHLLNHQIFMDCGHDEYWSVEQRNNVQAAIDAGIDATFFSGNTSFWETRWGNSIDQSKTQWRSMICYKETLADGTIDPSGTWTGAWRDPRFPEAGGGQPENGLTGTISVVNGIRNDSMTVPYGDAGLQIWKNTSIARLKSGQQATFPAGTLGYEWDIDQDNGFRPAGEIDLSSTTVNVSPNKLLLDYGSTYGPGSATHSLTLYRSSGGALVFSAGSTQFSWGLNANHDFSGSPVSSDMQQMAVNLLAEMGVQPATLQSGLIKASPSGDTLAPVSQITSPAPDAILANGSTVTITGTAADLGGGVVAGVEISVDGGATWHPASGRNNWSYSWVPRSPGAVTIESRATDDSANTEIPSDGITVAGLGTFGLFTRNSTPTITAKNDSKATTLGVQFTSAVSGFVTGVRFYKGAGNTGTHIGSLWSASGKLLASATFTNETASGWQQVTFSKAVAITAGTTYVVSYFAPAGHYAEDDGYFGTNYTAGPLTALADGTEGQSNGLYTYASSSKFPTNGNNWTNYWVDVVFSSPVSTKAPTIVSESPAVGASNVLTANITATFSESINPATLAFSLTGPGGTTIAGVLNYNDATHTATLTPSVLLAASTTYTATVSAIDLNGNAMAAPLKWTFTTAAANATFTLFPAGSAPSTPAKNDSSSINVGVRFTSSVGGYIAGIMFYKGAGNSGVHIGSLWDDSGTLLASATFTNETASGWQRVIFSAPVAINANTTYVASYLAPQGHYADDPNYFNTALSGMPLSAPADGFNGEGNGIHTYSNGLAFPTTSSNAGNYWVDAIFTTTPDIPPTVIAQTPPAGAGNVPIDTAITATFNESIQSGTLSLVLTDANNAIISGVVTYDDPSHTATFTPSAPLASSMVYTLTVNAIDLAGMAMTAPAAWSFTTAAPVVPAVISQSPAANAPAAPRDSIITAAFNESILPSSLTFTLVDAGNNTVPATVSYDAASKVASLTPTSFLAASTTYTATVSATDAAGNAMAAPLSWSFTTAAVSPPTVVAETPAAGASNAAIGSSLTATFDQSIQSQSLVFTLTGPGGASVAGAVTYNDSTHTATFAPTSPLAYSTAYSATVTAVNKFGDAMTAPFSWSFSSSGPVLPIVVSSTPAAQANNVATNSTVTATFNESVQPGTLVFTLTGPGNVSVASSVVYNDATLTATLTPSSPLATGTSYSVSVSATDVAGDQMPSPATWAFATVAPPSVVSQTPAAGSVNVAHNSTVSATFNEAILSSSLLFTLVGPGNVPVAATVAYNSATHVATLTPSAALAGLTAYAVTISATDPAGNPMNAPVTWSFTTSAAASSLWTASTTPKITAKNDAKSVEVGVRFTSSAAGFITGIRFYKGAGNTGTHIGNLWSNTGTLMASATFTGETASGWQQVNFASPVAITANTTYVASYWAPVGHYADDAGYFKTASVQSGSLTAPANGTNGQANGVYNYAANSSFPTKSYQASNYWVDVVFVAGSAPAQTPPATTIATGSAQPAVLTVLSDSNNASGDIMPSHLRDHSRRLRSTLS